MFDENYLYSCFFAIRNPQVREYISTSGQIIACNLKYWIFVYQEKKHQLTRFDDKLSSQRNEITTYIKIFENLNFVRANTLNLILYAPSTNQLCQFERQWSLFDCEPNKFSPQKKTTKKQNQNGSTKKNTWKSIPNARTKSYFQMECFDEVVLSACWNSIVLLFILFISLVLFVFSHSKREKEPVCRQLLLSSAAGHPPHRL